MEPESKICSVCNSKIADKDLSASFDRPICADCFATKQIEMEDELGTHELDD